MRRKIARLEILAEFGIVGSDSNDFVVAAAGIDHGHNADGPSFDEGERLNGFLAKDEDIQRIIVFGVGLRDEAIVGGIEDGGMNDAVDSEQTCGFVQLVFHVGAQGDFDQRLKITG